MVGSKILAMKDSVCYNDSMAEPNLAVEFLSPEKSEEELNPAALEFIQHFAQIVAEGYVRAIKKKQEESNLSKEDKDK